MTPVATRSTSPLVVWLAQGFGVGRIPFAPGTFGSLLGIGWSALLLWPGSFWLFALGTAGGWLISVACCGAAERALGVKDPGSVVLDEILALPVGFAGWLLVHASRHQTLPAPGEFFSNQSWWLTALVFVLFRIFDIAKPWPIRQSQRLPGGWGVTLDDLLAGLYTAAVSGLAAAWFK